VSVFYALLIAVVAMSAIVALRYVAVSAGLGWWTGRRFPRLYRDRGSQIRAEIGWSLASAVIYGLPAGLLAWGWQAHGWTRIYSDVGDLPLWYLPVSVALYLVLHDCWFYWTHRWMHRPSLFRLAHSVHHASGKPTVWAAMSFHPLEAVTGAVVIPLLVLVIPIHYAALLVVLTIMTVLGATNHMGWEVFPERIVQGRAGRWLITASHHERHHGNYRCNYGLYFRFWDRLCGTDRGLGSFGHGEPSEPARIRSAGEVRS
jgi:Delta7-sterol 5-desaturase